MAKLANPALVGFIVWSDDPLDADGEKLARRLHLPWVVQEEMPEGDWLLFFEDDFLYLHSGRHANYQPLAVDFLSSDFAYRLKSASRNDLLCKAVGLKKGVRTICDATCGLGYDAVFLASFDDLEVTACERNTIVAELTMDALIRLKDTGRFEHRPLLFHYGDAQAFLSSRPSTFDAVYMDPMYPREGEEPSAKPKKEMQLVRELAGPDLDAEALFTAAWIAARKRVVVKRPDHAPALAVGKQPDFLIEGKTVRFDVYLK